MPETRSTARPDAGAADLLRLQAKLAEVYRDRCAAATQSFADASSAAAKAWFDAIPRTASPLSFWQDAGNYWLDFAQRSVLFADTLRQRGNNWIEHEKAGKPPLLDFQWEMVSDARTFERPVNYALARIVPPAGVTADPLRRPYVVIDPRAGHGPGIGGFKQDSQVGVALKAGHPVYVLLFFPEPVAGQTLADVSRAEAEFLRIVHDRHPDARNPVVIGNCQGGWAAMLVATLAPERTGPIVLNGAPMSYWAGNDGENPMRYAGGILGGVWPALLASDLGGGTFDGANLVDNFEYLNPANTYFTKYYNLFSKVDTEPERFLEFERWWGGFFLMGRQEIEWIVDNLFVGNKLASGSAQGADGHTFDLTAIRSPIILFASLGDNITPPQQAFNWVADVYPTTEALKANGQVIVGLMHESVGHLGIFVSAQVARREHTQIVDLLEYIEQLPPGLYGMQVEERAADGGPRYDVVLTERRVEDLRVLQKYERKDELPFRSVKTVSDNLTRLYETCVHPVVAPMVTPGAAEVARFFTPQRAQRWMISDLNPFLRPLGGLADAVCANRVARDAGGPSVATERLGAAMTTASLNFYRDLRDATVEATFFATYAPMAIASPAADEEADATADAPGTAFVRDALTHIEDGDRTKAIVRTALLLMRAGAGQRRLSTMKRARELVGREVGLSTMPADTARDIIRQQSAIVDFEPQKALAALPKLVPSVEDRRQTLDILDKLEGRIEATAKQAALLSEIRRLLGESGGSGSGNGAAVRAVRREASR